MAPIDATTDEGMIPLCVPEIRGNEWKYVKECLDTNWVSSAGAYVERFETALAEWADVPSAVACVNGTSALHLALQIAGVEEGTEVLVSTLTFIAPANAIRYVGAHPVFVDAGLSSWQMDAELVVDFLANHCRRDEDGRPVNPDTGRRVSAILPVHILGHPVDLDPIVDVANTFDLPIIEDASESLGALYKERPVGGIGTLGCFSFNGNKMITTGGGGMIITDREDYADRARYLSTQAKDEPREYIHREIGYNYRLTNLQAAMGCAQMEQLSGYVEKKRVIAARYDEAFRDVEEITLQSEAEWADHARWLYGIRLGEGQDSKDRQQLAAHLADHHIQTRPLWQPMHRSPAHDGNMSLGGSVANTLQATTLCLPCSVGLNKADQTRVIDAVLDFFATL